MAEILKYFIGAVVAVILFWFFMNEEGLQEPTIFEKVVTDTCYIHSTEVVFLDKPQIEILYERDTVLVGYEPKIRGYKGLFPFLYGNVSVTGEVLGEVLDMRAETDFNIPQFTNTITREIHYPAAERLEVWGMGEFGSSVDLGIDVRRGKNKLGYRYDLLTNDQIKHRIVYGRLLFSFKRK